MEPSTIIFGLLIILLIYYLFILPPSEKSKFDPSYDGHLLTTPFVPPPIGENKFYVVTVSGPPANNIVGESLPPPISAYKVPNQYGTHRQVMEDVILSQ